MDILFFKFKSEKLLFFLQKSSFFVNTGRQNAMATIGVAYGYGSREELAGADIVCGTTAELMALLA